MGLPGVASQATDPAFALRTEVTLACTKGRESEVSYMRHIAVGSTTGFVIVRV